MVCSAPRTGLLAFSACPRVIAITSIVHLHVHTESLPCGRDAPWMRLSRVARTRLLCSRVSAFAACEEIERAPRVRKSVAFNEVEATAR